MSADFNNLRSRGNLQASHRCGLLLRMPHVPWSECMFVCFGGTSINPAKTAEPIDMQFVGGGQTCVGSRNDTSVGELGNKLSK